MSDEDATEIGGCWANLYRSTQGARPSSSLKPVQSDETQDAKLQRFDYRMLYEVFHRLMPVVVSL